MCGLRTVALAAAAFIAYASSAPGQTDEDIANQLMIDAVTGAGAAADPLYKRRLLAALIGEYPDTGAARSAASGVINLPNIPASPEWQQMLVEGGEITGYSHGQFPSLGKVTHPGFDIGLAGQADCGLPVTAPLSGTFVRVVSEDVPDSELAQTGIDRARNTRDLDRNTGNAVILSHGDAAPATHTIYLHLKDAPASAAGVPWRAGMTIAAGDQIGVVGQTGRADGCHLHFEARNFEGTYKYLHPTYRNIYPQGDVSGANMFARDWVDPEAFLRRAFVARHLEASPSAITSAVAVPAPDLPGAHAQSTPQTGVDPAPLAGEMSADAPAPGSGTAEANGATQPGASVASGDWGPSLVAGVQVGYTPCGAAASQNDACLRGLGFSDQAIAFSYKSDGNYSGSSIGISFRELGATDLAVRQFIGNTYYFTPILVNGPLGYQEVPFTSNLQQTFRNGTSQKMLSRYPRAINIGGIDVRSHRLLPDGTQRFTVVEIVNDGCRACPVLGSAVSFLEIGPSTGNRLTRRPVGLLLGDPDASVDMSTSVIRNRPESLQVSLNALGYDAGEMDGFPGPQTRRALMEFQAEHCLPPTGQPDPATANALLNATGFDTPCAGSRIPDGIAENTPLLSGMYVDDPALCDTGVPSETVHLRQRIIRGISMTWGFHGSCDVRRTDIRKSITLFRGTCSDESTSSDIGWRFDVQSNESFIDLDMLTALPRDAAPRRFSKCPDDSALRLTYGSWFGNGAGVSVPATGSQVAGAALGVQRVTFRRTMTLSWGGNPQGVVGTLEIAGTLDNSGLSLKVLSVNGRHNPGAQANPVDSGAMIDFFLHAAPRKNCNGCTPTDGTYRSETTIQLRNNILTGPWGETVTFVPMSVLERNDLVGLALVGSNNKIFLSDLTVDLARDLGLGG